MTMESLPSILFEVEEEVADEDMSDIQFLAIKEFDGKLRTDKGVIAFSITGDVATLTANTGKDMYLARAVINLESNSSAGDIAIDLLINGVVIETYNPEFNSVNSNGMSWYEFKNIGHKVLAGQIIKLEVTTNNQVEVNGFIECWEEDTGESPQIPPLKPV